MSVPSVNNQAHTSPRCTSTLRAFTFLIGTKLEIHRETQKSIVYIRDGNPPNFLGLFRILTKIRQKNPDKSDDFWIFYK